MPQIDISKLATLDERDGPSDPPASFPARASSDALLPASFGPPGGGSVAPVRPADAAGPPPSSAFAPPATRDAPADDDVELGVERSTRAIRIENEWQREREVRQVAAASPPPPPPPPRRLGGVALAVGLIVIVAGAVFGIMRMQRDPAARRGGNSVSIRITAHDPTEVTIDGQRAGKTPFTLQRPRSQHPIQISTAHATLQVVPDRDRIVDLSP